MQRYKKSGYPDEELKREVRLVRAAKRHIILIDNYLDDTVLTLLDKRSAEASATIFTRHVSAQLQLDLDKKWFSFGKMEIEAGELLSHLQNII